MSSPENVDLDLVKKEELSEGGQQEAAGYKEVYACTYCDRKYLYHTALITHMNIHLKKYQCQHCERCYGSYYNLKMHERTHTGEKPFSCPNCDKSFPRRSSLRVHYKTCIKPEEPAEPAPRLFECDKCDKRYATKGGLKQHRSVHTDKYKCDLCDARCHSKAALRTHRRIHTGERPFACQQCPYRARDKSVLNTHKKICKGNLLNRRRVYAYETPGRPINPRELPDLRVIEEDLMGDCVPSENLGEIEELERDYFRDEAGEYVLWHDIFDSPSKKPPPAKRSEEEEVCTFKAVMGEVLDDHQSGGGQEEIQQFKFNEVTDEIVHLAPLPDVHRFLFAEPKIRSIGQLSAPARPGFWSDEATKGVEKKIENPVSEAVPLQESFKFEESPVKTSIERYLQKEIVELKKDFKSQMMLQKQDFDEKIELQMQGYMRSAESQIRVIDTVAAIGEKIKQLGLELERMQKQQNRIHKKLCDFCREEGEISSSEDESVGSLLPVR